ncbi:MAG: glycosyltransferase family 39 protein [Bacteroidota bacterium]
MKKYLFYILIGAVFFAYVLCRAFWLSVTYDEAWTLACFVPCSIKDVFLFVPCDANNQILNTLFIKLFFKLGFNSVGIARLPNVLAFILYMVYGAKIARRNFGPLAALCLFVLLVANPFVLDFFSLARGYGLALAFMLTSVYYVMEFHRQWRIKPLVLALLFASLAVLSNFTLLNFMVAAMGILIFVSWAKTGFGKQTVWVLCWNLAAAACLAWLIYTPLHKLILNHSLYYGGSSGVFFDSLVSLVAYSMYDPYHTAQATILAGLGCGVFVALLVFSAVATLRKPQKWWLNRPFLFVALLLVPMAANVVEHVVFGTLFLIDRTALFYIPLLFLALVALVNDVDSGWRAPWLKWGLGCVTLIMLLNFAMHANGYKTVSWQFDAHTKAILQQLDAEGKAKNKRITIDYSWPFESAIHFYIDHKVFKNLSIWKMSDDRESMNPKVGYYFYYNKSLNIVGYNADEQTIVHCQKDTALAFERDGVFLFKNIK